MVSKNQGSSSTCTHQKDCSVYGSISDVFGKTRGALAFVFKFSSD